MNTKLHLGCGTIYLKDYINIDVKIPNHYLAKDRADLVEKNITTTDQYFKNLKITREDIEKGTFHKSDVVVDMYSNGYTDLPFEENTVDEIRLVQVFEHFTYKEGEELLNYWYKILKPNGVLHLDVPDLDKTCQAYSNSRTQRDKDWYCRLLMGSQKNEFAIHKGMYNPETLKRVMEKTGFKNVKVGSNIHFYPAFNMEGNK